MTQWIRTLFMAGFSAAGLVATTPGDAAGRPPVVLQREPFRVEAESLREKPRSDGVGWFEFRVVLAAGTSVFPVETWIFSREGDYEGAVRQLRKLSGTLNGYYFVPNSCGGGNRWRCHVEEVFALRDGKLQYLGQASPRFAEDWERPGASMEGRYFVDVYDELEHVSCHACSPKIKLMLEDAGNRLAVRQDLTWEANQDRFRTCMDAVHRYMTADQRSRGDVLPEFWFAAALAKYCGKEHVLDELDGLARTLGPDDHGHHQYAVDTVRATPMPPEPPRTFP